MVTAAIVVVLFTGVRAVIGLVPEWDAAPDAFSSAGYSVGAWAGAMNGYVPLVTIGVCLALLVAIKLFLAVWRLVLFIYHQFWGAD